MRRGLLLCTLAVGTSLAALVPAGAVAATPWTIGAKTVVTSPPAFSPAQDLVDFPELDPGRATVCPRSTYNGPRGWRFEEPYADTDGSRSFSYPLSGGPGTAPVPEPFCDYNHNGRWDGLYLSGGVDHQARSVHDDIDARAVSFSDGQRTVVLVSVVAQGLFQNYTEEMRTRAEQLTQNGIDALVVSANHNESSPDTVGIYGGPPDPTGAFGVNSGIDEYYMDYLVEQVARAAAGARDDARPASLRVRQIPLPADTCVRLSKNFPTTSDDGSAAAIDPKVRILQALDANGAPIFTMMNLAAHNQEIGHSSTHGFEVSADWPGYFAAEVERLTGGGVGLFLAGDNGSEEDPSTVPPVGGGSGCDQDGSYAQAQATGETFARDVVAALDGATAVPFGAVDGQRSVFCVPIENNLFKAASAARLFGERPAFTNCANPAPTGNEVRTEVNVLDVGPELQFIGNPGEAFPALMLGSPWGIEDVGCPGRPNPPVPTWHARATSRFQVGLANDLIGYEIPAWAYSSAPGLFANLPPNADMCANDADDRDPAGHQHKLETEGVGPTASNMVASELTRLLDARPDADVQTVIRPGRFLAADGSTSRRAAGAVGIWLADPGAAALTPGTGTIIALPGVGFFGPQPVNSSGVFTDYDGAPQAGPGITTRGMRAGNFQYYVDPYPALGIASPGAARPPLPGSTLGGGGASGGAGAGGGTAPGGGACRDTSSPASSVARVTVIRRRRTRGRLIAHGSSSDLACGAAGSVASVKVAVARLGRKGCRYLRSDGTLTASRRCARPVELAARGTSAWRLRISLAPGLLPRGLYRVRVLAVDAAGNSEPRRPENKERFRLGG